jgi:aspartyl-tRNA(Asn)/glutamyl-tRNA(Gln) amidotransferase subunit C
VQIDTDLVKNVALLSQLNIEEDKLDATIKDLNQILALADQMENIDTDGVEPMANPLDSVQRLRPDVVTESNKREAYQSNAPQVEQGYFLVPRVVE